MVQEENTPLFRINYTGQPNPNAITVHVGVEGEGEEAQQLQELVTGELGRLKAKGAVGDISGSHFPGCVKAEFNTLDSMKGLFRKVKDTDARFEHYGVTDADKGYRRTVQHAEEVFQETIGKDKGR